MIKIKSLYSLSFFLGLILWICLFIWRKTFSYININGIYIIELILIFIFLIFILIILLKKKPTFIFSVTNSQKKVLFISVLFIFYNFLRAFLSSDINPKALIPGVYPVIFIISFILTQNSSEKTRLLANNTMMYFYPFCFLVYFFNSFISDNIFGTIESPGWTFIYGVSMSSSLFLFKNKFVSLCFFGINFILAIISFERASFANFALSIFFVFLCLNSVDKFVFIRTFLFKYLMYFFIFIFLAPILVDLFFDLEKFRFDITASNILKFFYSIFSSKVDLTGGFGGLSGTRDHRLDMWGKIIDNVFSSFKTSFFGFGFKGEVLDILNLSFRAPHNGFITILYRGGLVGLVIYLLFIQKLIFSFFSKIKFQKHSLQSKSSLFALLLIGAFVGDAFTGTIIDSPFTSFLFYFHIGLIYGELCLNLKESNENISHT